MGSCWQYKALLETAPSGSNVVFKKEVIFHKFDFETSELDFEVSEASFITISQLRRPSLLFYAYKVSSAFKGLVYFL